MMLLEVPEIDIIVGMDDTSTTLISPDMFDEFNVELTNKRADLIHKYGKFYMHHSCGLIHDLLPIYRKTRMDAVHAFTTPPIGNVLFPESRKLLGDRIAIATRVLEPHMLKPDADGKEITAQILARFQDVKKAGSVILYLNTPSSQYGVDFMKRVLSEARKYQKL
jgi:uroporphyrinogen-III decarboxylase